MLVTQTPPLTVPIATRLGLNGSTEMDSVAPAEKLAPVGRVFDVESAMLTGPTGCQTGGGPSTGAGPPMVIDGVSRTSRCSTRSRARPRGVRPARPDPGCSHDRRLSIQEDIIAAPVA